MKLKKLLKDLDFIKFSFIIQLFICAFILAFNKFIGILIMIAAFYYVWRFFRCPHCNESLDPRIQLRENTHCPHCGKIINK